MHCDTVNKNLFDAVLKYTRFQAKCVIILLNAFDRIYFNSNIVFLWRRNFIFEFNH